ncbi:MAG: tetratricopeptide repeat protein [Xanthomonadales bacterium]|nr:tetratricopeptide repeat protein [Xanthomonadales bacterium]
MESASDPGKPIAATPDREDRPAVVELPTDEEVMYRVFAAEVLGAEGDLPAAVGEYVAAALQSEDPRIAQRATRVAFAAQDWQQAAMAADRWTVLEPENPAAKESAVVAMLAIDDYAGAEYQLLKLLEVMGNSPEAWTRVSSLLAQSKDAERASDVLDHILATHGDSESADALHARSQLAVRSRKMEKAFELARQAVELEPQRVEFLTWTGRVALNLDLADTAVEYIRRAWRLQPDDHDLSLAYADLLARTGNEEAARDVMATMPQSPDVMLSRILFELAADKRENAEQLFEQFGRIEFDDNLEQSFYQAQAAEALGSYERAIELYGAVDSGERALPAAIRRIELIAITGDLESARQELATLRASPDEDAAEESWLAEARILREVGQDKVALEVLDEALQQFPDSVPILYSHALLAAELGRVDLAERGFRLILAEQPENAVALNALGYTLADQTERYEEAEALIRQAYILQPNEASIVDSMGWIAYRRGRLPEAVGYLRRAWKLDRNPEIAAHLGEVLWKLGSKQAARAVWLEGQEVDAENPVLMETIERLDDGFDR